MESMDAKMYLKSSKKINYFTFVKYLIFLTILFSVAYFPISVLIKLDKHQKEKDNILKWPEYIYRKIKIKFILCSLSILIYICPLSYELFRVMRR